MHVPAEAHAVLSALGRAVAARGCVLITGACPGLPQVAVESAKAAGAMVIGISPALSRAEHVHRYRSPTAGFDVIVYNGSGLMGREVDTIRSSDIVIIAGGRSGTLGEFSIAYDEGHLIGVLTGTGGIADHLHEILEVIAVKDTGARGAHRGRPGRAARPPDRGTRPARARASPALGPTRARRERRGIGALRGERRTRPGAPGPPARA